MECEGLDAAVEAYIKKSKASCQEVGYGKPDDMYVDWAADAFRKGVALNTGQLSKLNCG